MPSEIWKWDYWFFEEMIKRLNEKNKKEEDERKKQDKTQNQNTPNYSSMMNKYSNPSNFKPPSTPKFR